MGHTRKPRRAKAKKLSGFKGFKLPAGFKAMEVESNIAPVHDFEVEPEIIGKVVCINDIPKGGKIKKDTRVLVLRTAKGDRSVWESAVLGSYFDKMRKGKTVWIRLTGYAPKKRGQNPAKLFVVAVK